MMRVFISALFAISHSFFLLSHGYPTSLPDCTMILSSQPSGPFGKMSIANYAASTTACTVTISGGAATFEPCQTYTLTVASNANNALAVAVDNGDITNKNLKTETKCGVITNKVKSGTFKFRAPPSGAVSISAICGDSSKVFAATKLSLTKNPTSPALPSCTPVTSPTVAPTAPGVSVLDDVGSDSFTIQYEPKVGATTFTIRSADKGWIGIGLASPSGNMVGGKAIIGMNTATNTGYSAVQLYNLADKAKASITALSTDTTLASTYGIVNASFTVDTSASILQFSVLVDKQSPDFKIASKEKPTIVYASGGDIFDTHTFRNSRASVDFTSAQVSATQIYNAPDTLMLHGALMVLTYCILFPVGVSFPLFNNKKNENQKVCGLSGPTWYKLHRGIQIFGLFLALVGFFSIISFIDSAKNVHFNTTHKNLGLFIILASIANPIYGILRPHKPEGEEPKKLPRKIFEWLHPIFGYLIIFLGFLNCYLGVGEFTNLTGGSIYQAAGQLGAPGFGGSFGITVIQLSLMFGVVLIGGGLLLRLSSKLPPIKCPNIPIKTPKFCAKCPKPSVKCPKIPIKCPKIGRKTPLANQVQDPSADQSGKSASGEPTKPSSDTSSKSNSKSTTPSAPPASTSAQTTPVTTSATKGAATDVTQKQPDNLAKKPLTKQ